MEKARRSVTREEGQDEMSQALVDTGFLVAIYDEQEPKHDLCVRTYDSVSSQLLTCEAVIGESLYLLRRFPEAVKAILLSVDAGVLSIPFTLKESARSVSQIMLKYRDTPADFADACLIHMADEMNTGDILTLDGDFKHYRWRRNRAFRLLIPLE